MPYVSTKEAKKAFGVREQTLRRWANSNKIKFIENKCANHNEAH